VKDDLEQLLAKSDIPAPPVRQDLAYRVRQVVKRRRHRRRAIAVMMVLLAGGVATTLLTPRKQSTAPPIATVQIDVEAYRKEIAVLDAEAKLHMRIAEQIQNVAERHERLQVALQILSQPDAITQLDEQRQAAAQLILMHAQQLLADPRRREEAVASYRNLLRLFPDTLAGREALNRLNAAGA
jgi:hypothetical protein